MNELQAAVVAEIETYVSTSPLNRLRDIDGSPIFDAPLVGFADGDDPLFELYTSVVAPGHMTPRQALAVLAPAGESETPGWPSVGVVSWILPAAAETRLSNRQMVQWPSLRWNHTRFQGEEFNDSLRRHIVGVLENRGLVVVAPVLSAGFGYVHGAAGLASTWSERHVAYAAGLGTFGLSDGLITARGIAHRCGSVVVNAAWPASPRPYTGRHDYCLYLQDGSCGACIKRCPAGAIGPAGHDKDLCLAYVKMALTEEMSRQGYIGEYPACGLCQTGGPCEDGIPGRAGYAAG